MLSVPLQVRGRPATDSQEGTLPLQGLDAAATEMGANNLRYFPLKHLLLGANTWSSNSPVDRIDHLYHREGPGETHFVGYLKLSGSCGNKWPKTFGDEVTNCAIIRRS